MVMVVSKKEDKLQAVWFAAGMAALMACLERAILVSFVEQWRVIAFLLLNLLLLAILFTSTSSSTTIVETSTETFGTNATTESKIEVRKCSNFVIISSENLVGRRCLDMILMRYIWKKVMYLKKSSTIKAMFT